MFYAADIRRIVRGARPLFVVVISHRLTNFSSSRSIPRVTFFGGMTVLKADGVHYSFLIALSFSITLAILRRIRIIVYSTSKPPLLQKAFAVVEKSKNRHVQRWLPMFGHGESYIYDFDYDYEISGRGNFLQGVNRKSQT